MPTAKVQVLSNSLKLTMFSDSGVISGGGGSGVGGTGFAYFRDITVPGGTRVVTAFHDPPNNTIVDAVTVSSGNFNAEVIAGTPLVNVNGVDATLALNTIGRFYEGSVPVVVAVDGNIVLTSKNADGIDGATDTVAITIDAPPTVTQAVFSGPYPTGPGGLQTELAEDNPFDLSVTADKDFDLIEIQAFGAAKFASIPVATGAGPTIVQITAADQGNVAQLLSAQVRVRDATTGAFSTIVDTNGGGGGVNGVNVVNLNNQNPGGAAGTIVYPGIQAGLKGVEQATVNHTATDFDSIAYSNPLGEITIANPTVFEAAKVVTATASGVFNNSSTNFSYLLTRNANGTQTTVPAVVVIADVLPIITVSLPAVRLRSGGNNGTTAQDHTITISSNQPLLNAPSMDADSGGNRGAFQGAGFINGPSVWTRALRVDETVPDEKGIFTFENLVATGLAGSIQTVIGAGANYELGGFVARVFNWPAFTANSTESVELADETRLSGGNFSNGNASVRQPFGTADTTNVGEEGWYAPTAASGTVNIRMLHSGIVASNATGITLTLEELP